LEIGGMLGKKWHCQERKIFTRKKYSFTKKKFPGNATKVYGGEMVYLQSFLTSHLRRFMPAERASGTRWIISRVGFRDDLDILENTKDFSVNQSIHYT
jgi:hypothetical protein